jgi:hypothetical protein
MQLREMTELEQRMTSGPHQFLGSLPTNLPLFAVPDRCLPSSLGATRPGPQPESCSDLTSY